MSITKSLFLNNNIKIKKIFIFKKKIIIQINNLTSFNYFFINKFYMFNKKKNTLIVNIIKKKIFLNKYLFFFKVCKWLMRSNTLTLLISGVGYKVLLQPKVNNVFSLDCQFGFSHKLKILIPNSITVSLKKKKIIVKSSNPGLLGNFLAQIKSKRPRNVYTGQGFWLKQDSSSFKFKIMKR